MRFSVTDVQQPPDFFYVRNARRVRAQFAQQPSRMHRALRDLTPPVVEELPEEQTAAERFANLVLSRLEGGLLRYSARLSLLKIASAMGIERFEANLIIAAILHHQPKPPRIMPKRGIGFTPTAIAIIVIQGAILAAVIWVMTA